MYLKRAKLDLLETNRNPDDVINKEFCIGIGGKDYNIVCEDMKKSAPASIARRCFRL